ncbi:MAG TPA: hypothetical protein VIX37_15340 [Candidatus Sulfotelmatobacter sp.]
MRTASGGMRVGKCLVRKQRKINSLNPKSRPALASLFGPFLTALAGIVQTLNLEAPAATVAK